MNREELDELMKKIRKELPVGSEQFEKYDAILASYTADFVMFANAVLDLDKQMGIKIGETIIGAVLVAILMQSQDSIDEALARNDEINYIIRKKLIDMDKVLNKDV